MKRMRFVLSAIDCALQALDLAEGRSMSAEALRIEVRHKSGCNAEEYRHAIEDLLSGGMIRQEHGERVWRIA